MTTGSDRRQKAKLHWYCRGRADQLVTLGRMFGWSTGKVHGLAKRTGLNAADVREALARLDEGTG